MNIVIIGAGAVGLGVGSCLIDAGEQVTFVDRRETYYSLRQDGLRRSGIFGERSFSPDKFNAVESIDGVAGPVDFVLVCTKSFDSPDVADSLATWDHHQNEAPKIVLFQNGWGNFEVFAQRFEPSRVFNARVITGFQRAASNHVEITVHADAIKIGSLAGADVGAMGPLAQRIAEGGIPAETSATVGRDLWAKMLYNCCLNPLGAVLEVPYGNLGESEATRSVMDAIADEIFSVMRAAGHTTHWDDAAGFLADFYDQMLPSTSAHCSSMLQDLRAGRRTEIDAMSGAVVALGERHDIATPVNRVMRDLVRFRQQAVGSGQ